MTKLLSLVPFLYTFQTRIRTSRDVIYLVATAWIPGWWLVFRLTSLGPADAALAFAQGFLAFIAIYEIGYFANDTWDAVRGKHGRKRLGFAVGPAFAALFIAVRVGLWGGLALSTGWLNNPAWLAGYVALVVAFTQHNVIKSAPLRIASFVELATLRFVLPIIAVLPASGYPLAIVSGLLLYVYLRFLSYMDSKSLLNMPERKAPNFGAGQLLMLAPLVAFVAYICRWPVLFELYLFILAVHAAYPLLAQVRSRRATNNRAGEAAGRPL